MVKCPNESKAKAVTDNFLKGLEEYLKPTGDPIPEFVTNTTKVEEILERVFYCNTTASKIDAKYVPLILQMIGVIYYYKLPKQEHLWLADGNDSSDWKDRDKVYEMVSKLPVEITKQVKPIPKITFFDETDQSGKETAKGSFIPEQNLFTLKF